jgi:hypothetical protein
MLFVFTTSSHNIYYVFFQLQKLLKFISFVEKLITDVNTPFFQLFPEYPRVVEYPMSLDIIKKRLEPTHPDSYKDIQQFIDNVRLIFKNAYAFNPVSIF